MDLVLTGADLEMCRPAAPVKAYIGRSRCWLLTYTPMLAHIHLDFSSVSSW